MFYWNLYLIDNNFDVWENRNEASDLEVGSGNRNWWFIRYDFELIINQNAEINMTFLGHVISGLKCPAWIQVMALAI